MSAVLEPMDHGGRLGRLIDAMPDGIDGLLVTSLTHVRYLTGLAGSD